jgi:hypothetical protein
MSRSILAARADKVLTSVYSELALLDSTTATAGPASGPHSLPRQAAWAGKAPAAAAAGTALVNVGEAGGSRKGVTQGGAGGSTGGGAGGTAGEPGTTGTGTGTGKAPNVTQLTRILNPHIGECFWYHSLP